MEQQFLKQLLDYGGAIGVIGALIVFLIYLKKFISNGNNLDKRIREIEENHLKSLEERVERLEDQMIEVLQRVSKIEAKINEKLKNV